MSFPERTGTLGEHIRDVDTIPKRTGTLGERIRDVDTIPERTGTLGECIRDVDTIPKRTGTLGECIRDVQTIPQRTGTLGEHIRDVQTIPQQTGTLGERIREGKTIPERTGTLGECIRDVDTIPERTGTLGECIRDVQTIPQRTGSLGDKNIKNSEKILTICGSTTGTWTGLHQGHLHRRLGDAGRDAGHIIVVVVTGVEGRYIADVQGIHTHRPIVGTEVGCGDFIFHVVIGCSGFDGNMRDGRCGAVRFARRGIDEFFRTDLPRFDDLFGLFGSARGWSRSSCDIIFFLIFWFLNLHIILIDAISS
jgi:hypothetical protein